MNEKHPYNDPINIFDYKSVLEILFVFCRESRYLLILTQNYAALNILQQQLDSLKDAIIIFGSSFPNDQEYTQVGNSSL